MNKREITKTALRYLITFLCVAPFLIWLGLTLEKKVSDFVMIIMFAVMAGGIIVLEEVIYSKLYKRRQRIKEERKASFQKQAQDKEQKEESQKEEKKEENIQKNNKKEQKKRKNQAKN